VLSSVSNFFVGLGGSSIPAASTAFEMALLRRCSLDRVAFSKPACVGPTVSGWIGGDDEVSDGASEVVRGVGNRMYNPPVRCDRPSSSSDGAMGIVSVTARAASNSTSVSSDALKILKCLLDELRASAAKAAFRRITGRDSRSSSADVFLAFAMNDVFLLNNLRDLLRTGKGIDGKGLGVLVAGRVLDLERDGFGTRSDIW
jgi:hypothetical protein